MKKQDRHSFNVMIRALKESDLTYKELSDISGFTIWSVIRMMQRLKNTGEVHICGFHKDSLGRDRIIVWRYGNEIDAVPKKSTPRDRQRKHRAIKRQVALQTLLFSHKKLEPA